MESLMNARVSFVGAGNMAEAMINGVVAHMPPGRVRASHPRLERRETLTGRYGIDAVASNRDAIEGADVVLLCVKPQLLDKVSAELQGAFDPSQLVVSVLAGTPFERLRERLDHEALVRAMPNTPAQIGQGMTVWTRTHHVSDQQAQRVASLLSTMGQVLEVDSEKHVDMATALSGTGPTYVFLMMEALVDAGVHLGFSRRVAEQLVTQTVAGSVAYAAESGRHLAELRNMVTSPGGTSADAIYQMEKGGLRTILSKSVYAAFQKAQQLSSTKGSNER